MLSAEFITFVESIHMRTLQQWQSAVSCAYFVENNCGMSACLAGFIVPYRH